MKKGSLFSDAIGVTTSKIIVACISLLSTMLLSRFRSLTDYGTYSELIIMTNIISTGLFLGIPNSITYFVPRAESRIEKKTFIDTYYSSVIILGLVSGLALVGSLPLWSRYFENSKLNIYWFFLLVFPFTKIMTTSADNMFICFGRTRQLIAYRVVHSVSQLFLIFIVERVGLSFYYYMVMLAAEELVFSFAVIVLLRKEVGQFKLGIDRKLIKRILVFSIPLGLSSAVGMLNIEIDKLVIGHFLNTEELAIYSNASRDIPISFFASAFTVALMPRMTRMIKKKEYNEACEIWHNASVFSFYIIAFFVFFFCCFAKDVLSFLYSDKYVSGTNVFIVYSLGLITQTTYFGMMLNVSGNTKFIFWGSIISLVSNLILNVVLFQFFGVVGPAIATVLSTSSLALYQLLMTSKKLKINFSMIVGIKDYLQPLIIATCMYLFFREVDKHISLRGAGVTIKLLSYGIVSSLIYFFFSRKKIISLIMILKRKDSLEMAET